MDHIDLLPFLIQCGDIAFNFLRERLLTKAQIETYLQYMNSPGVTFGQVRRKIVQEDGRPDEIFLALESLSRINAICDTAESPSEDSVPPERAFNAVFCALRAGIVIGGLSGAKEKQKLYSEMKEELFPLAEYGLKFSKNTGKHDDEFTDHLINIFQTFHDSHKRYPRNKEIEDILRAEEGQGFIHTIDDEVIEWGKRELSTSLSTLKNRLTHIRNKLGKNHGNR